MAATVCGITFSLIPDRCRPPTMAKSGRSGKDARAWLKTFTIPACEHAVKRKSLLTDVHGNETLVHDELIELPAFSVEGSTVLARQAGLKWRDPGNFTADVGCTLKDQLRFGGTDDQSTMRTQSIDPWHILHLH
jgi:hypothetical protein